MSKRGLHEKQIHGELETMNIKSLIQVASLSGVTLFMLAANASATTITFNTNQPGTGFNGTVNNTLNSSSGASATLVYTDNGSTSVGVPSNVNYGQFTLKCTTCTTQAGGTGASFAAFTFDLLVTDTTDSAAGHFHGTSSGGAVFSDVSQINIAFTLSQLGSGTNNATSGTFGNTVFNVATQVIIVAPNTGTSPNFGVTSVQGTVSGLNATPEPATFAMFGGALLGLGLLRRKSAKR